MLYNNVKIIDLITTVFEDNSTPNASENVFDHPTPGTNVYENSSFSNANKEEELTNNVGSQNVSLSETEMSYASHDIEFGRFSNTILNMVPMLMFPLVVGVLSGKTTYHYQKMKRWTERVERVTKSSFNRN